MFTLLCYLSILLKKDNLKSVPNVCAELGCSALILSSLYSTLVGLYLEYCIQLCGMWHKKDRDLLEQDERIIRGLEHIFYEEKLRELWLLSTEKRRLHRNFYVAYQNPG